MKSELLAPEVAHQRIADYAKKSSQAARRVENQFNIGQWARQGDVYLIAIKSIPKGAVEVQVKSGEYQLAKGATMGSRHMLLMREGVSLFRVQNPGPLDGGTIVVKDRAYISHPEHAHLDLPAGVYECRFQQHLSMAEITAVRD